MKKFFVVVCCFLTSLFSTVYAGGGITHMFIAEQAISRLPDPELRHILLTHQDAYLVGAYYPDSGYVKGCEYGEISHWDPFIYAFADHIKEKYNEPTLQNPKLIAFLFGCATHRISDEIMHFTFYEIMKDKDFHGSFLKAHFYGDLGIDLLLNIDKSRWKTSPSTWWVPVKDLLAIYNRMGLTNINARQIIIGNKIIQLAGYGEKLISLPTYPYLQLKMPWTAWHYYDWPVGGIKMDIDKVVEYQMQLWQRLKDKQVNYKKVGIGNQSRRYQEEHIINNPVIDFAKNAIEEDFVTLTTTVNDDGSIDIEPPVIKQMEKFKALITQLTHKVLP